MRGCLKEKVAAPFYTTEINDRRGSYGLTTRRPSIRKKLTLKFADKWRSSVGVVRLRTKSHGVIGIGIKETEFVLFDRKRLSLIGMSATIWPTVPATMMDYDECVAVGGMIGKKNRSTRRNPSPVTLRPPQNTHHLIQVRSRARRCESSD
jgi:hypothetical protein